MNNFEANLADTAARTQSELQIDNVRERGGFFVEAVRHGRGMGGPREGSLGYGLVEALVRQIGGEMRVEGECGVTVTIRFPSAEAERPFP
jgi:two-component sensor histidine kinase